MSNPEPDERHSVESSPDADPSAAADQAGHPEGSAGKPAADSGDISETVGKAEDVSSGKWSPSPVLLVALVALVTALALGGVAGWLSFRTYQLRQDQGQRDLFLRAGRQGAVNLTTIDWQNVNSDIQRILDSSTGIFYDDFSKRSQPFVDAVKKIQSKSEGTVTEAGLESASEKEAQVLVAVSVKTSTKNEPDQPLRYWRMRINVQKVDDSVKVSNVLFVPA